MRGERVVSSGGEGDQFFRGGGGFCAAVSAVHPPLDAKEAEGDAQDTDYHRADGQGLR